MKIDKYYSLTQKLSFLGKFLLKNQQSCIWAFNCQINCYSSQQQGTQTASVFTLNPFPYFLPFCLQQKPITT